MDNIQLVKFKIVVLLVICLLFSYFGWTLVQPRVSEKPMIMVLHAQPFMAFSVAMIIVLAGGVIGQFFGSISRQSIGMFGVPAGLCLWAVMSGDVNHLLPGLPGTVQRAELFQQFALDALCWSLVLATGFGLVLLLSQRFRSTAKTEAKRTDIKTKEKTSMLEKPFVSSLAGLFVSCLIAFILLKILMQSEKTWTEGSLRFAVSRGPVKTQALFAIFAAFFLGTLVSKTLFKVSLSVLLAAPLLLSLCGYLYAAQNHLPQEILDRAPEMVLPSIRFGLVLPIQFLAFGSIAVIFGYWSRIHVTDYDSGSLREPQKIEQI